MKKILLSTIIIMVMSIMINLTAQTTPAKRYVLFEHFTNASCSPCAAQNPFFEEFYNQHKVDARHISFHTSWPGTDPMHALTADAVAAMVSHYGVTGVPSMFANGTNIGGPASANEDMLNAGTSPIRIHVTEAEVGGTRNVTVSIETVEAVPDGTYFLRVAAVEELVSYSSAPGSNGEKDFPDVFRKWAANEVPYTPAAVGESVTFEYSYPIEAEWEANQIYTLAYVVNQTTKEVLNSGTTHDVTVEMLNVSDNIQAAGDGGNTFSAVIHNTLDISQPITIHLVSNQPADWTASFSINGTSYTESATLDVVSGISTLELEVTNGASAGIGKYALEVTQGDSEDTQTQHYIVINGVTDLVANAPGASVDILTPYTDGLAFAENTSNGALSIGELKKAFGYEALDGVANIYLSIGWTFPAFSDELVSILSNFLDNGGNLLVAGQDIGWDVMSNNSAAHGTPAQKAFYTNYLQTNYVDDGSPSSNAFTAVPTDAIFGEAGGSSVQNVYGGTNLYPDHITPATESAHQILKYTNDNGGAAVRVDNGTYKVVYFGIGLEHVGDVAVSNQLMKITHDWFHSTVGTADFDKFFENLTLTQNQPNPADNYTEIRINGAMEQPSLLTVTDITGKTVLRKKVSQTDKTIRINTAAMNNGVYFYHLANDSGQSVAKKMVVTH